jgi:superfamily I DNA/RNA helicase
VSDSQPTAKHPPPAGHFLLSELDLNRHALIIGSPASGKTTQLRHLALAHLSAGTEHGSLIALVPQRLQAAALRDQLAFDLDSAHSEPRAQTLTGFAFNQISRLAAPPTLVTGPQQQTLLAQIAQTLEAPSWLDSRSRALASFVDELRAAINVCQEFALEPAALRAISTTHGIVEFDYLADALTHYREQVSGLDAPSMLRAAARLIRAHGTDYQVVLIDDAQELTPAAFDVLDAISQFAVLHAFADPDASVLGFRAASVVELVGRFESFAKPDAPLQRLTLPVPFQTHPSTIAQLLSRINSRITPARAGTQRKHLATASQAGDPANLSAEVFDSLAAEADWLATELRLARVHGTAWSDMVVVARTRRQLDQLAQALSSRSVPCQIAGSGPAIREQPASRSLLELARFVLAPEVFQPQDIEALLVSPFGGFDSISLRRLKRQLRFAEHAAAGTRPTAELLLEACQLPGVGSELDSPEGRQVSKLAQLVAAGRAQPGSLTELLGQLWRDSNLAKPWRDRALAKTEVASAAQRDLDAVLALFAAAERAEGRSVAPLEFIQTQLSFAIAEDTLARRGQFEAVTLATTAGLHRGYSLVALPRLQEGIWPNLRPRNSLFRANRLDSFLRTGDPETLAAPLPSELTAELRLLYRAIGSARERLLLSGMHSTDESPSQFFSLLLGANPTTRSFSASFDLRRRVGQLRASLASGDHSAAAQLAALAAAGVAGAHPKQWLGREPSDDRPLFTESEQIRMRPSQLAKFETCPLHWFIAAHGGDGSGFEANLGSLLHEAFELTDGTVDSLSEFVDANFANIDFQSDWHAGAQRRRAQRMILSLAEYVATRNRETVMAEAAFEFVTGRLQLSGKIDLIEKHPDGSYSVADLKTGATPTAQSVIENRQLALYQLALKEAGLVTGEVSGARIISVGGESLRVLEQPPLEAGPGAELTELLERVTEELSRPALQALVSEHCSADQNCQLLLIREVNQ